jgi:hypothetical protein
MSMDDEDSKIRRNLVTASAIVIVTAWLDVSVPDLLERIFSLKASPTLEISSKKVWAAVLAVLCYFGLRYRWSDEVDKAVKDHTKAVEQRYYWLIQHRYLADAGRWAAKGRYPADAHPMLANVVDTALGVDGEGPESRPQKVTISPNMSQRFGAEIVEAHIHGAWAVPKPPLTIGGMGTTTRGVVTDVPIDAQRIGRYLRDARIYAYVYSKSSMALTWPVGLLLVAAGVALYRLVCAFL